MAICFTWHKPYCTLIVHHRDGRVIESLQIGMDSHFVRDYGYKFGEREKLEGQKITGFQVRIELIPIRGQLVTISEGESVEEILKKNRQRVEELIGEGELRR